MSCAAFATQKSMHQVATCMPFGSDVALQKQMFRCNRCSDVTEDHVESQAGFYQHVDSALHVVPIHLTTDDNHLRITHRSYDRHCRC
jgi:hypothetical protein